jgi:hypothetical protein
VNAFNGRIELVECGAKRARKRIAAIVERRSVWSKDSEIQRAVEECDAQTGRRHVVSVRAGLSLNQAAKTETSQVVDHLCGGIRATNERRDAWPQIAVAESRNDMGKAGERLTERVNTRIAKSEREDANGREFAADGQSAPAHRS